MFHDKELDRAPEAEPQTTTVMVGHCPVTVPASTVAMTGATKQVARVLEKNPVWSGVDLAQDGADAMCYAITGWPAYSKDYEAGYRDGYAAAQKDADSLGAKFQRTVVGMFGGQLRAQQANDFKRILGMERKADRD